MPGRLDTDPGKPIKQTQANSYLRTGPVEEAQLVEELDFESAKVGATESDAEEEEEEAAAREEEEEQRICEELEKRKAEIMNSTTTETFVM